jgi:hypothetical protein
MNDFLGKERATTGVGSSTNLDFFVGEEGLASPLSDLDLFFISAKSLGRCGRIPSGLMIGVGPDGVWVSTCSA